MAMLTSAGLGLIKTYRFPPKSMGAIDSMKNDAGALRQKIFKIKDIPALPLVMNRVLEVVMDERSSAQDLAREISRDPALTGKLLKIVNSAFYGFYRQISSVEQAVVILGYREIRSIAITVSVFDLFGPKRSATPLNRMRLWEHCLAVGTLAEILREQYCRAEEAAFVAGLLHDIGIIILDEYFASEWGPALARAEETPERPLIEWETESLGMTHAEAGYYLSERWNLPWAISQAILNHHRIPAEDSASVLDSMIYLSNALVKQQGIGFSGDPYPWPVNREALASIGMRQEDLGNVTGLLAQRMESMRALLGFLVEEGK